MTAFHSKIVFIGVLSALCLGCTEPAPNQAPVTANYSKIPPETSKKEEVRYHLVKKGDSLYGISLLYDLDYRQIAQWNRITLPYKIEIGQKLRLSDPNNLSNMSMQGGSSVVRTQGLEQSREQLPTTARTQELEQRREQLPTTARTQELEQRWEQLPRAPKVGALVDTGKYYVKKQKVEGVSAINEINLQKNPPALLSNKSDLSNNTSSKFYAFKNSAKNSTIPKKKKSTISIDNVNILMLHFQWPIKGKILKAFSQADNKGIDIAGQMGLAVSAAEAGTVVYSGQGLMGYGNVLIIKHNDLFLSAYANNSQLLVVEGSTVKKGEVIAKVGQSGSNKTSLHFEIRKNGKPVNPVNFLPEK